MEKLAILVKKAKTVAKSNRKIVERDVTLIPPTHTNT
jgi:hypothetical protein